ncbi:hypothetical protein NV379_19640 [Paenibacillus sp. N1-5-1-14]|uniref:hypothetical protein n=1 Tax=Paenibacillus radicibacter TaxID=2972488 RepID=UPI002158CAB5|nr:hypothetical protein [Paenibacillus radicibacter]MCR8644870.1 hypothetical protein [Paenibacillus radicibacter]
MTLIRVDDITSIITEIAMLVKAQEVEVVSDLPSRMVDDHFREHLEDYIEGMETALLADSRVKRAKSLVFFNPDEEAVLRYIVHVQVDSHAETVDHYQLVSERLNEIVDLRPELQLKYVPQFVNYVLTFVVEVQVEVEQDA